MASDGQQLLARGGQGNPTAMSAENALPNRGLEFCT